MIISLPSMSSDLLLQKIIIVNRKLAADAKGVLQKGTADIDVEVRSVWQPWLRRRCDFVVRYIVPDRVNIFRIMQAQNKLSVALVVEEKKDADQKQGRWLGKDHDNRAAAIRMTFKPTLLERLLGKKKVVIDKPVPIDILEQSAGRKLDYGFDGQAP